MSSINIILTFSPVTHTSFFLAVHSIDTFTYRSQNRWEKGICWTGGGGGGVRL